MFPILIVLFILTALYWFPVRRWFSRWGTTPEERTRVMAGDKVIGGRARPTDKHGTI